MKLSYCVYIPGMPCDGRALAAGQSLGGSETAGLQLAQELQRRGHQVVVFCNIPPERAGRFEGVLYLSHGRISEATPYGEAFHRYAAATPHDVLIAQRGMNVLGYARAAKLNLWWIHDIALKRHGPHLAQQLWNLDGILTPSAWHADQAAEVYGLPRELFHVVPNAIDPAPFTGPLDVARKQRGKTLVYSSRPERGLEHLVGEGGIMERLWAADPEIRLVICGYDHVAEEMRGYYEALWARCDALPNVTRFGSLGKAQLAEVMRNAWLHVYPTMFEETSCITAMEEQAAGTPFLATCVGALPETLTPRAGPHGVVWVPLKDDAVDPAAWVREILALRNNPDGYAHYSQRARKESERFTWARSADALEATVARLFEQRQGRPARLARHLMVHSDVMALRHQLGALNGEVAADPILAKTAAELEQCFQFVETGDYHGHYQRFYAFEMGVKGTNTGPTPSDQDLRYRRTQQIFDQLPAGTRVLEWGCAHGPYTNHLAKRYPDLTFVGVDLIEANIEVARKWSAEWGLTNVEFFTLAEFEAENGEGSRRLEFFDLILAGEVAEHVPDPGAFIDNLVQYAKDDARFLITTPAGPWEYASRNGRDWIWRGHIQHLEQQDIQTLFGHHPGFNLEHIQCWHWKDWPCGWHLYHFRKPTAPSGKLDLDAKLARQAPRETLTVCMIARSDGDTLAKTLRSVESVADQIVIGIDQGEQGQGPKDGRAWEIAESFGAEAFGIVSPVVQGFDAARNQTLDRAAGDWILWIDDDETLVWPERVGKYLRPNAWDGYAIKQVHYALDPQPGLLKVDLPMRLFRNRQGFRFYGVVHEHPERGLNDGVGRAFALPDVAIAHNGYSTEEARRERFRRNWPLMERDHQVYPERKLGRFLWLRDLAHINRFEAERLGGRLPPGGLERCEEGITIWRALVAEGEARLAVDGLPYYSELVLQRTGGQGALVGRVALGIQRDNLGGSTTNPQPADPSRPDNVVSGNFLTPEDLTAFTACIQADLLKQVEGERYW